jgi:hypothetical protein
LAAGASYTGNGDYVANSRNISNRGSRPNSNSASFSIIERREWVTDIVTSNVAKATSIQKFRVNPGNPLLAKWGSKVAWNYESYFPMQCVFEYVSTSADAMSTTNTSLGKVVMAAQYNTFASEWDTLTEIENAQSAVMTKPSKNARCGIECKAALRGASSLFVSETEVTTAGKAFYDMADFYIATSGLDATSVKVGALYIVYKMKVFNPVVNDRTELPHVFGFTHTALTGTANPFQGTLAQISDTFTPQFGDGFKATFANASLTLTFPELKGDTMLILQRTREGSSGTRQGVIFDLSINGAAASGSELSALVDGDSNAGTPSQTSIRALSSAKYLLQAGTHTLVLTPSVSNPEVGVASDTAWMNLIFIPWEAYQ